jgi:hypothetical protein
MQPFSYNTLLPCPVIDHPEIMRTALQRWGAYPTHEGAEKTFTDPVLCAGLNKYSREVDEVFTPIWEREYGWAERWMEVMDHPPEKIKARRKEYYANREKEKEKVKGVLPR